MSGAPLLIAAALAVVAAWGIGWPAWTALRDRRHTDLQAERYYAWRGRASRGSAPVAEATQAERVRLLVGGTLAVLAVALVVAFLAGA